MTQNCFFSDSTYMGETLSTLSALLVSAKSRQQFVLMDVCLRTPMKGETREGVERKAN